MNAFQNILSKIRSFFSDTFSGITSEPYFRRYLIVTAVLFLLFSIFMFPYNIIVENQLKDPQKSPFRNFSITGLDFSLLSGFAFNSVVLTTRTNSNIEIKNFSTSISPIGIYFGSANGTVSAEDFFFGLDKFSLQSKLSSTVDLKLDSKTGMPSAGSAELTLTGGKIENLPLQMITLPQIAIEKINLKVDFSPTVYTIKSLRISGKELSGSISGKITVNQTNFNASTLDLKAEFIMGSAQNPDAGKIPVTITGTIANPQANVSLQPKTGGM